MRQPEMPSGIPSALIAGVCGGILMALVMIRILIARGYGAGAADLAVLSAAGAALMLCGEIFERAGLPVRVIEAVMLGVSCLFMLIYGNSVALDQATAAQLRKAALVPHAVCLAVWSLRFYFEKDRGV